MMLKVDQISCRYGQVEVLQQVSLHLEQGEILGLLGPVSYTHLRAHETEADLVCRLLLEKKKKKSRAFRYL